MDRRCACGREHYAKGLCKTCYDRMRYNTIPEVRRKILDYQKKFVEKKIAEDSQYIEERNKRMRLYVKRRMKTDPEFRKKVKDSLEMLRWSDYSQWNFRIGYLCNWCGKIIKVEGGHGKHKRMSGWKKECKCPHCGARQRWWNLKKVRYNRKTMEIKEHLDASV